MCGRRNWLGLVSWRSSLYNQSFVLPRRILFRIRLHWLASCSWCFLASAGLWNRPTRQLARVHVKNALSCFALFLFPPCRPEGLQVFQICSHLDLSRYDGIGYPVAGNVPAAGLSRPVLSLVKDLHVWRGSQPCVGTAPTQTCLDVLWLLWLPMY